MTRFATQRFRCSRRIAFSLAVLGVCTTVWGATAVIAAPGDTERVSVSSTGQQGSDSSGGMGDISADGRFVAFEAFAPNLVPGDTNGYSDVFVRDRQAGTTERVSVSSTGDEGNSASGGWVDISSDGRYVVFYSNASNLVNDDTNGREDYFLHDRLTGATERISVPPAGGQFQGDAYNHASVSASGRYVAFAQASTQNSSIQIYVRDRQAGTTTLVTQTPSGAESNSSSIDPNLSDDGRFVVFDSFASDLVSDDTNGTYDVFVRDLQSGTTNRVSVSTAGDQSNGYSTLGTISRNGRFVVFTSGASNLTAGDTNNSWDMFLRDRQSGTTEIVSRSDSGGLGNNSSDDVGVVSDDGRYVEFSSTASNLVSDDTNGARDIFVRDRSAGHTYRENISSAGDQAQGNSLTEPGISADGRIVAFRSNAGNLVTDDTNGQYDVFVHQLGISGPLPPASVSLDPASATNPVDTVHTVTARVVDANGQPSGSVTVRFAVAGSVTMSGSCLTSSDGTCSFSYAGPSLPGADAITAYVDANGDGVQQAGEPAAEAVKAWLAPATTSGQVTGGGQVDNTVADPAIAFGFTAKSDASGMKGECTVVDVTPVRNVKIKCTSVTTVAISGTHAEIFGAATVNGVATTYRIDVDDLGEPGRNHDTFRIQLASGYNASGTLTSGNIQIHS